jgi:hypothetical protein
MLAISVSVVCVGKLTLATLAGAATALVVPLHRPTVASPRIAR